METLIGATLAIGILFDGAWHHHGLKCFVIASFGTPPFGRYDLPLPLIYLDHGVAAAEGLFQPFDVAVEVAELLDCGHEDRAVRDAAHLSYG